MLKLRKRRKKSREHYNFILNLYPCCSEKIRHQKKMLSKTKEMLNKGKKVEKSRKRERDGKSVVL